PGAKSEPSPLGARYQILRELGQGGFGLTYLAEDLHRFKELTVLKEFVPQVDNPALLTKAKQLFEREAGVLYQLQHPQIPRFRELLRVPTSEGRERLFLVQDYVEGPTYRDLLNNRQRYGGHFNETEITQLLYQLLPVLDYLHSVGVVHRDISPENLILRNADGLPVLIDFGSVKQVAAEVQQQLEAGSSPNNFSSNVPASAPHPTRIGKVGYVPPEQLQTGTTDPSSDLYALAATALVLATGREPSELYDAYHGVWNWSRHISLGPELSQALDRMLAFAPRDRFASATAVLQALRGEPSSITYPTGHRFKPAADLSERDALGLDAPGLDAPELDALELPALDVSGHGLSSQEVSGSALSDLDLSEPNLAAQSELDIPKLDVPGPELPEQTISDADVSRRNLEAIPEDGLGLTLPAPDDFNENGGANPIAEGPPLVVSAAVEPDSTEPSVSFVDSLPGNRPAEPAFEAGCWQPLIGLLVLLGLVGLPLLLFLSRPGGVIGGNGGERDRTEISESPPPAGPYSNDETNRKARIQARRSALEIDEAYFNRLINQIFYRQYPKLRDRPLTSSADDAPLRLRWDNIAVDTLDLLEQNLSQRARRALGSYGPNNRDAWRNSVNRLNVSSKSLYDLADGKFVQLFPNLSPDQTLSQPIGQIWYGLSDDRVRDLESGEALETVQFEPGAYSQQLTGQLSPGDGQVITLQLTEGQILRLNLQAAPGSTLLSLYLPTPDETTPFLLSDSSETTWSGQLSQSGIYEVVVVSRANESISYRLNVAVDNVRTTPAPEPEVPETDETIDSSTEEPASETSGETETSDSDSETETSAGEEIQ
ncbi:MAG: serine/threonine-protein kinase, partial [Cyanobacteria bacterium J06635_1]